MSSIPGFFDLDNSSLAAGQALTDDVLIKTSSNAKFGAVRCEVFWMGFFINGNTVPVPISPVDGYAYVCAECQFIQELYSTGIAAPGFVPGQTTPPVLAPNATGGAQMLRFSADVDDATGLVSTHVEYYVKDGAQTNTNDGVLKVRILAQRLSVNQSN